MPLPCGLVQVVTGMALFTMLRFPLSFAFIIAVQFINMKTSLKRISTFLENPELDPAALEGARRGRPSRELLPTASPSATIIEVAVERADKAEGSARAPLRAAEVNLQRRMLRHAESIFAGIGVEFRLEKPTDYRLYSTVEITGADPNGIGLIGYDNTPGKDVGNQRLYDQIGGVHAQTQEDGFPGYGGVFLQSTLKRSV